jgi:hypothetical protein
VNLGTGYVAVKPDMSKFGKDLGSGVSRSLQDTGRSISKVGGTLTKSLTLPIIGIGALSIKAFAEADKAAAQTEAVLKSTGGAANISSEGVGKLADKISAYAAVDDDAVRAGENMLLTFTNVRNEVGKGNDIFNQSTSILADMSQALGVDMSSQAIQLGKALNDPVKGLTALTRVGVTFTDQQKAQVAQMVKTGDTIGAQKLILGELKKEFGGSAKAFGDSAAGGLAKFNVTVGNLGEKIGALLIPAMEGLTHVADFLLNVLDGLNPTMQKVVLIVLAIVAAVGPLLIIVGKMVTAFGIVKDAMVGVKLASLGMLGVWALVAIAVIVLVVIIVKNWGKIKAFVLKVWQVLKAAASAVWGAIKSAVATALGAIRAVIVGYFNIYKAVILGVWHAIQAATSAVWRVITGYVQLNVRLIKAAFDGIKAVGVAIWDGIYQAARTVFNGIASLWNNTVGALSFHVPGWVPGIGGSGFDVPDIPMMGTGGVTRAPLIAALNERGSEAIVPLTGREGRAAMAQLAAAASSGGSLRVVHGTLDLSRGSRATIAGWAREEDDADASWRRRQALRKVQPK